MNRRRWILTGAAAVLALASAGAMAQTNEGAGLPSLSEDRVLAELANRGLDSLLNRAFENQKVPAGKRDAIRTMSALQELGNPESKLTARQRDQLIKRVVTGIESALPQLIDPRALWDQAAVLLQTAIMRDVNLLEYWGENPRTQGELRPIVETVLKMLEQVQKLATEQAEQIANTIRTPDDPAVKRYTAADSLATMARYTHAMTEYYLALAIDAKAGMAKRKEVATGAIEALAEFDNADSTVQPEVRNRVGKLNLAADEYDAAKKAFVSVIDKTVSPAPNFAQQYEARYFSAVADVLAGKLDAAGKAIADLRTWQKANIPPDNKAAAQGAEAAAAMLDYRLANKTAELAENDADREKANKRAVDVLLALVKDRPELRNVIYGQLMARLPTDADLSKLDPLLLQALVQKGDDERRKEAGDPVDAATLERAVAAARELVGRKDSGVERDVIEQSALLVPFFLEKLDRKPEAAAAFLDFIDQFPQNRQYASIALDNARVLVGELIRSSDADARIQHLYERFLTRAVTKFNQTQFAYEYARLLQRDGKYRDAIKYFAMVAADDPRALKADFLRMVAMSQVLNEGKPAETEKTQLMASIQSLATKVNVAAQSTLAAANDDAAKRDMRSLIVKTSLLAASLAGREAHDSKRVLQLLQGFEDSAKGLPGENELLGEALFLRVQAYMDLGQNAQATDELVKLLAKREGGQGANIIFGLLQKLDKDLDAAGKRDDQAQMRSLARARADLSRYLVDWAANNADPKIRQYTYRYRVFDADTKHLAAKLEPDAGKRQTLLREALEKYQSLRTPESVAAYHTTLAGTDADPSYPDPAVMLGIAKVYFDLGDYKSSQQLFGQLLADKKLGTEMRLVDGEPEDNAPYWEANYKLFRGNVELAKSDPSYADALEQTKKGLKFLYIKLGSAVGGKMWHGEFEKLRQEIIPDFKVQELDAPAPAAG